MMNHAVYLYQWKGVDTKRKTTPMSVIIDLSLPSNEFELGRILEMETDVLIELAEIVPMGETTVPFFWVYDGHHETFEDVVRAHPSVDRIERMTTHDDRILYALDWVASRDTFFAGIQETEAQVLSASGTAETWQFELQFPGHDHLSAFQEYCINAHIPIEVDRVYNPTKPGSGPWFGLTGPQRDALVLAVERGYYSIPRKTSTIDLADELGISDQAVTERLRRGIITLVKNTLMMAEDVPSHDEESDDDDD